MLFNSKILLALLPNVLKTTGTTDIGKAVGDIWGSVYTVIKEVGGTLAVATLAVSGLYYFVIGQDRESLDKAKRFIKGSIIGIIIIYLAPLVIKAVIEIVSRFG